jgi:hypothetical protein
MEATAVEATRMDRAGATRMGLEAGTLMDPAVEGIPMDPATRMETAGASGTAAAEAEGTATVRGGRGVTGMAGAMTWTTESSAGPGESNTTRPSTSWADPMRLSVRSQRTQRYCMRSTGELPHRPSAASL